MATIKKSGGWKSSIGGTDYKGKGGKICISGTEKGKGIPSGGMPSGGGEKKGQSFYMGAGAGKGIPKQGKGGTTSDWAARHD